MQNIYLKNVMSLGGEEERDRKLENKNSCLKYIPSIDEIIMDSTRCIGRMDLRRFFLKKESRERNIKILFLPFLRIYSNGDFSRFSPLLHSAYDIRSILICQFFLKWTVRKVHNTHWARYDQTSMSIVLFFSFLEFFCGLNKVFE